MIVKQADNMLRFFEYFAAEQQPATLTQAAETLQLPVSSTSNLIKTLLARGYLFEVRRRGGYYPTRRLYDVGNAIVAGDPVLGLVREHMEVLREHTGETIVLAVRNGSEVIYLEVLESNKAVRYSANVGDKRPIYTNSAGKAILAAQSDSELKQDLARMDYSHAVENSISEPKKLFANISEGKKRGWFLNATEYTPDVSGVGVGLKITGQQFGLSIAGPNYRMEGCHNALASALQSCAEAIHNQVSGN